jgi:putative methionine-R-sulfoxide reductase with GAF domain
MLVHEMEQVPTVESNHPALPLPGISGGNITAAAVKRALEPVLSSAESNGNSLSQMAQRDLDAALKLLVDRAQYITGASGAALALNENGAMVCRATAGACAPQVGSQLQVNSGLTGECVRLGQILRCDNAENDPRVNHESCRVLSIVSVLVAPLLQEEEVIGVFELFSSRAAAFEERDALAVQRLTEIIQTAVGHARAVLNIEQQLAQKVPVENIGSANSGSKCESTETPVKVESAIVQPALAVAPVSPLRTLDVATVERISEGATAGHLAQQSPTHRCESCGFPVSEGRKFCVDCEEAVASGELTTAPVFLSQYSQRQQSSWVRSNIYWIGMVLVSLASVAALVWLR